MIEAKSAIIEQFAPTHAEAVAAARFFHNDNVEQAHLLRASQQRLRQAAAGKHVLLLQDTTEVNYSAHSGALRYRDPDLGPLAYAQDVGFFFHPSLALDAATGFPLGLAEVLLWNRSWHRPDKYTRRYHEQPIEAKESYRWIASSERAGQVLSQAAHVTIIADREGDIFTWFAQTPDAKTDLLVRARIDRRLVSGTTLYRQLEAEPSVGALCFSMRSRRTGQQRSVHCQIRISAVEIARPRRVAQTLAASLPLWAVEVRELSAPSGEEPVLWRLLSSRPVANYAAAQTLIDFYRQRWQLEQYFRTLKRQGLALEASQLRQGAALKRLALVASEAALVVLQLVQEREGAACARAKWVFSSEEIQCLEVLCAALSGRTAKQQNPYAARSLAWASWVIARLGGWKCYGGPPGPIRMSRGLRRFADRYAGWSLTRAGPPEDGLSENQANDVYGE